MFMAFGPSNSLHGTSCVKSKGLGPCNWHINKPMIQHIKINTMIVLTCIAMVMYIYYNILFMKASLDGVMCRIFRVVWLFPANVLLAIVPICMYVPVEDWVIRYTLYKRTWCRGIGLWFRVPWIER